MNKEKYKILITNDDGIESEALHALEKACGEVFECYVVVPDQEKSAASMSLSARDRIKVLKMSDSRWTVAGTPVDCICCARMLDIPPPDLVISGINMGANLGNDVFYSGTVGASFEAAMQGFASMAISSVGRLKSRYEDSAQVAVQIAQFLCQNPLPPHHILNVNYPDFPLYQIKGFSINDLGLQVYGNNTMEKITDQLSFFKYGGYSGSENIPGSDCNACKEGFVSMTPLTVLRNLRSPNLDLKDHFPSSWHPGKGL